MNPTAAHAFGRLPLKPFAKPEDHVKDMKNFFDHYNDDTYLEERIDLVRKKIQLNDQFARLLLEEKGDSKKDAVAEFRNYREEARILRKKLAKSLMREKAVVQCAMDAHQTFQTAMTDRTAMVALPWMEDKVFDSIKRLNLVLNDLLDEKNKIEEAEKTVRLIEELDEDGLTPEEHKLRMAQEAIEVDIEEAKVKRETSTILRNHYAAQIEVLKDDNIRMIPVAQEMDKTYEACKEEAERLTSLCEIAKSMSINMGNIYETTKKTYNVYERARRSVVADKNAELKAIKAMRPTVTKHLLASINLNNIVKALNEHEERSSAKDHAIFAAKNKEIRELEGKIRQILEAFHVPDISFCGARLENMITVGAMLKLQVDAKEEVKDLLDQQSQQLTLIKAQLMFGGNEETLANRETAQRTTQKLSEIEHKIAAIDKSSTTHRATFQQIREGLFQLLGCLGVTSEEALKHDTLTELTALFQTKVVALMSDVRSLQEDLLGMQPERDYSKYVKTSKPLKKHIRVSTPVVSPEEDEDEYEDEGSEFVDTSVGRVIGRAEIKERSRKIQRRAELFASVVAAAPAAPPAPSKLPPWK